MSKTQQEVGHFELYFLFWTIFGHFGLFLKAINSNRVALRELKFDQDVLQTWVNKSYQNALQMSESVASTILMLCRETSTAVYLCSACSILPQTLHVWSESCPYHSHRSIYNLSRSGTEWMDRKSCITNLNMHQSAWNFTCVVRVWSWWHAQAKIHSRSQRHLVDIHWPARMRVRV